MTRLLASVSCLAEVREILATGADLIDLKNPAEGALGALKINDIQTIVNFVGGQRPVSATIGDLPLFPEQVFPAVLATAATGVDFVKIGFFSEGEPLETVNALEDIANSGIALIAVLFADLTPDLGLIPKLARAGFKGAMLDTSNKLSGSLRDILPPDRILDFVKTVQNHDLLCGLAGSLTLQDIEPLLEYKVDYLGFRGALCDGKRSDRINPVKARNLVDLFRDYTRNCQSAVI